jgi:TRAP transporter 4TM/12TM fusion protein
VGAFFYAFAHSLVGDRTGGAAKATVIASSLVGMVSMSGIGNAATVGAITIPIMKKTGFSSVDAAAIEAVGSTGGVIMPPVMGAVAFLIAQYLGISYGKIVVFAAPPAIMYYTALFAAAHWKARRGGLKGIPRADLPSLKQVVKEGWHLSLPLIALIIMMIMGFSVARCGFVAVIGMILLSFVRKETRMKPVDVVGALGDTSRGAAVVASTLILVGVVTGVVNGSGLGVTISLLTEKLAGGSILIALGIAAVTALVLGLALSGMIVYLYGAVFVIPTLIDLGANPLSAHLFFLYYGTLGNITPPVCVTAFTAAAIAGAPMMKTGFVATKIAFVVFLIPFLFVLNPVIILQGFSWSSVPILALGFVGVLVCAAGAEGYFLKNLSILERALFLFSGLSLLAGAAWTAGLFIGSGVLLIMISEAYIRRRSGWRQST